LFDSLNLSDEDKKAIKKLARQAHLELARRYLAKVWAIMDAVMSEIEDNPEQAEIDTIARDLLDWETSGS